MQIICKLVEMAGVHSQLQSQALSFPLRHLGSFSIHMEEQDESTCDLSTQLKQTARREWEKSTIAWMHLRSGICFGCIGTWNPAYAKIFIK